MVNSDNVRKNLKKYRQKSIYTKEQLAEEVNKNPTFLSKIESGSRNFSTYTLIDLLNAFDTNLNDFTEKEINKKDLVIQKILSTIFTMNLDELDKEYLLKMIIKIGKRGT